MNTNITQKATIIGTYSQRMLVRTINNEVYFAKIKGKKIRIDGYLEEFSLSRKEADELIMSAREIAYK